MVFKTILLATTTSLIGFLVGAHVEYAHDIKLKEEDNEREKSLLEKKISPYKEWITPKPNPFYQRTQNRNDKSQSGLLNLVAYESDVTMCTMDLSAAQGRLNLIKSDHYLIKDHEEQQEKAKQKWGNYWTPEWKRSLPLRDGMIIAYSWRAPVAAARFGHLHVLKWFEPYWNSNVKEVIDAARQGGHEEILSYIREKISFSSKRNFSRLTFPTEFL